MPRVSEQPPCENDVRIYRGQTIYNFDSTILLNWYPKRIIELSKDTDSILELGIGHGITTNLFSKFFRRHVVLDHSPVVIDDFRKNFSDSRTHVVETSFETYETDEKFNIIVMGFILEHVTDPISILRQYKRMLMPNGCIYITVPNAESLNRQLGNLGGLLRDLYELSAHDINLGHKRYYTSKSLKSEVVKGGFQLERLEGMYLKPFTTNDFIKFG